MKEILTKLDCTDIVVEEDRVIFTFMGARCNILIPPMGDEEFLKLYLCDCIISFFAKHMRARLNERKYIYQGMG